MPATPVPDLRLFLALWPPAPVREQLAQWRDAWSFSAGASPTRTERLHITLHFIGPVAADRMDALATGLACNFEPFTLDFGRAELWPHGIAVLCPDATPAPLRQLHGDLADALRKLALPVEERAFRAHVTLARRAQRATVPAAGPSVRWNVEDGYALVQSLPGGQGYRVLQRFG
jgi:2'-5' RNA ligase